ncbi:MAG: glycosyltransferase, partial [Candidatus Omnitrophica bacterium]|nr:glycosyltransferase [Candidatus Omnitrophota bacterium]
MKKKKHYLISAIVSAYKSERFMRGKLVDLLKQTIGRQLEIIVVDSHSPENEGAIVREFMKSHSNIKYIRTKSRESVYQAWNRGIQAASGMYITNANTDDRLRPDAF